EILLAPHHQLVSAAQDLTTLPGRVLSPPGLGTDCGLECGHAVLGGGVSDRAQHRAGGGGLHIEGLAIIARSPPAVDEQLGGYGGDHSLLPVTGICHGVLSSRGEQQISMINPITPIAAPVSDTASNAGEVVPVRASPSTTTATEP